MIAAGYPRDIVPRPSEPLLVFLRDAIRRKGLSTADLAERVGKGRAEIKRALAGTDPLTVDDLVLMSQALQLTPAELGLVPPDAPQPTEDVPAPVPLRVAGDDPPEAPAGGPDPFGNLPEQVLRLGFTLGLDLMVECDSTKLGASGIPKTALDANPKFMKLAFPAKYHKHNQAVFGAEAFGVRLSFDKIYTCALPWESIRGVSFILPAEEPAPPAPAPEPTRRPALRVVK